MEMPPSRVSNGACTNFHQIVYTFIIKEMVSKQLIKGKLELARLSFINIYV